MVVGIPASRKVGQEYNTQIHSRVSQSWKTINRDYTSTCLHIGNTLRNANILDYINLTTLIFRIIWAILLYWTYNSDNKFSCG